MPRKKKGPTKLIIRQTSGTGTMDDISDIDYRLTRIVESGQVPEGVQAQTAFRETGVVVEVQSDDPKKAQSFADELAHDDRNRFYVSIDTYKPPWTM